MRGLDQIEPDSGDDPVFLQPGVQADLQGDANRYFTNSLNGRLDSLSSVRQRFDKGMMESLRVPTRDLIHGYVEKYAADASIKREILAFADTASAGSVVDLEQLTYLQLAHGLDPMAWAGRRPSRAKAAPAPERQMFIDPFGNVRFDAVLGDSRDDLELGSSARDSLSLGSQMLDSIRLHGDPRDSAELGMHDRGEDEKNPYPRIPKRRSTLVDGMSILSLLDQPRAFTADEIEALFTRIGERDPFAASVFGKTERGTLRSSWFITEATAKEAKRILNEDLGVDLTYQGHDFARPADWINRDHPAVDLDPGRQLLVNGLVDLAVSYAQSNRLAPAGAFDMMEPFGVVWQDRRYRSEGGPIASFVGKVQARVGKELTPYMRNIDVKDPLLAMLFPQASNWQTRGQNPVQDYFREASDFLLSWLLPGTNIRDIQGRHWVPKEIKPSVYRTINNLREEFGAPRMGTILTDDAQIRPVSFLLNASSETYSRGWFGFNPFGDKLMGWDKIRNAKESMEISSPVLSAASTMSKMAFVGGSFYDPYLGGQVEIENNFKLNSIEWNEKSNRWKIAAPRISQYQLDHMVPLSYLWEHGYERISEEILRLANSDPNGIIHEAPNGLRDAAILGGSGDGSRLPSGSSPERDYVMRLLEFMSRAGLAANPDQFNLVTAKLNQDKGAKGPGAWLPFQWASSDKEHQVNANYVRGFRSVLESERKAFAAVTGRTDPNFLREDREDALAMRRVDLGLDQTGRFTRWAADTYLNYFDMPNLEDPTLYHSIRAWSMVAEAKFGAQLALWQFSPANQIYLRARQYVVSGFGGSFFAPEGGSMKQRAAAFVKWIRDRHVGTPLVGSRALLPGVGDDALLTLHDIVRSGKVQSVVAAASDGEALRSHVGKFFAADPTSIWRYAGGEADAFGRDVVRTATRREVSGLPEFRQSLRARYQDILEAYASADPSSAPAAPLRLEPSVAKFWQRQALSWDDIMESSYKRMLWDPGMTRGRLAGVQNKFILGSAYAMAGRDAVGGFSFASSSQVGRQLLQPTPFLQEAFESFRAKDWKGLRTKTSLELLVKLGDYGLKGSLGTFAQLPAVMAIEFAASKGSSAMGVMTNIRPEYGKYDFSGYKGGLFGWYRSQLEAHSSARKVYREDSRRLVSELRQARARAVQLPALRANLDRMNRELELGEKLRWGESPGKLKHMKARGLVPRVDRVETMRMIAQVHDEIESIIDAEDAANRQLTASLARAQRVYQGRMDMVRMVAEEAPWIDRLDKMDGWRGDAARWAAQHPRFVYNVAKWRNLPGDLGRAVAAPVRLHSAVAARINQMDRLFPVAGRIGAKLEANGALRFMNKAASVKSGARAVGGALNALGFIEIGVRHRAGMEMASRSWGNLSLEERGALESYVFPSTYEKLKERVLDAGGPFILASGFVAAAHQLTIGQFQSLARDVSRSEIQAALPELHREVLRRATFNSPTMASEARVDRQVRFNRNVGLVDSALVALRPRVIRDSGSYFSEIRSLGASRGDSEKRIEREVAKARQAFQLIPRTDSLGYGPGKRTPEGFQRALFQQAPQSISDFSVVIPTRGKVRAVTTEKLQPLSEFERRKVLGQAVTSIKRDTIMARALDRKRGFFDRLGSLLLANDAFRVPTLFSQGVHADSAALAKEFVQRDSLRAPGGK